MPSIALSAPSRPMSLLIPIAPTNGGRIKGTKIAALRIFLPGKVYRALRVASGSEMMMQVVVTAIAILSELINPVICNGS